MSVLIQSRKLACLPFCPGVYELRTGDVCRISCRSFKLSSHSRFRSSFTPCILSSSLNLKQRKAYFHPRCPVAGISHFQEMMCFRDNQAKHSVLIELASKEDIPRILNLCKQYGEVKNMIAFCLPVLQISKEISGANGFSGPKASWGDKFSQNAHGPKVTKLQVIAEYVSEESVQKLFSDCSFRNISEGFPAQTRFLRFRKNEGQQEHPTLTCDAVTDLTSETDDSITRKEPCSVSEMMVKLYEKEKMSDLSTRLRFLSCVVLKDFLKGIYPDCAVLPFGSSVNGFGKDSSDLDMMLRLYPEQVNKNSELFFQTKVANGNYRILQQNTIMAVYSILCNFIPGANNFRRIMNARVPIVKYNHRYLNLECDVSINNMSPIFMSEILFFCGELDSRVRPLMYTVRKWAKEAGVTFPNPGGWITNFSLSLLLLFFLQTRPVPILPPLNKVIKLPSADDYRLCAIEYVNLKNLKPPVIGKNTESLDILLKEFFRFLATFPFNEKRISVIAGVANSCRSEHSMWVDYPLDESLNVTKNITPEELINISTSAFEALKNLEKNSDGRATNLVTFLGLKESSTGKIDVRTFFDESSDQHKAFTSVR